MRTRALCLLGLLVGAFPLFAAGPIPTSNTGREYLLSVPDLHDWSCGTFVNANKRGLDYSMSYKTMEWNRAMGYVGYNATPWLTTYLIIGSAEYKIGAAPTGDSQLQYGIGANVNLLDKDILDPTLMEDKIRVTLGLQYVTSKPEWKENPDRRTMGDSVEVSEVSGSLLGSIVNDVSGNKFYLPNSIALFGGILFSDIRSDSRFLEKESESIGYTVGLEVFYSESVTIVGAAENFDEGGYTVGVNVRF